MSEIELRLILIGILISIFFLQILIRILISIFFLQIQLEDIDNTIYSRNDINVSRPKT